VALITVTIGWLDNEDSLNTDLVIVVTRRRTIQITTSEVLLSQEIFSTLLVPMRWRGNTAVQCLKNSSRSCGRSLLPARPIIRLRMLIS
jgi:hypothetical protein